MDRSPVDVACTFDGRAVDAPNGQAMSFALAAGADDSLTDLPVGASCVVAETDDDGATSTTYASTDPNVITTPSSATVTIDDVTTVSITNTFEVGPVTVAATLTGPGAPTYGAGRSFTVRVGCTRTINGRTFPIGLPADGRLVLDPANGLTAAIPAVPAGATCAVVDDETHLATSVTIPPSGVVVAGDGVKFVIGLDWELGTIVVTKAVVGLAPAAVTSYPFVASCAAPTRRGPVAIPLAVGAASFALDAGASQSLAALTGAACTILETDGRGATTSYALAGGEPGTATSGIGVVLGRGASGRVTVTNAFVAPSAPTTTAEGPSGGGGRLPSTGSSFGPILVVAGVALALGLAVSPLARRRPRDVSRQ
jgi:LPXTG-motif cell wall-anchored protein